MGKKTLTFGDIETEKDKFYCYKIVTFLYPLKTSENLWFSDVFRGYRNMTLD